MASNNNKKPAVPTVETPKIVTPVLTGVKNKTNQKQVIQFKGVSYNIPPRGIIQLEASFKSVSEDLAVLVSREILTITKI